MKRLIAGLLALTLFCAFALAENADLINARVAQAGFKAITAKNKTKLAGCWFTEDGDGDTLQWSDANNTYTVTARPGSGLRGLYAELLGMRAWDTCSYTIGSKVQFAFNASEVDAAKEYKTLRNYAKYVSEYIAESGDTAPAGGQRGYVLNTSTRKFHNPDCQIVPKINSENWESSDSSRDALIKQGYEPCKLCNP